MPLDTDDLSYPRIVSDFSGMPRKPIVDLGAAMSALSASTRRTLGGKAAEGFPTVVSRPEGIRSHSTAFVPGVWMGDLRLPFTANVVGDRADELPDLFGWTALAPLGPILLDFQGGEIDWAPQPPPEFLETILTFYSVRLSERELIWGTRRVPLASVRSIFGLPFDPSTRKLKGDKFNPMTAKEAKAAFFSCPPSVDVVFERDGKQESFSASYRNVPRPAWPVPLPRRSVFTVPGYYLNWEGKKMLLPPGPVWVPEGKGRILAVGAVPPAPPSNPFGGYEITMIPDLLTLDRDHAEFAGWRREPIPKIMAPGRAAPVPVAISGNFYVVPKGHAFSSGRMAVVPPEGEGSFQLLRIPK
ncbi:hypothetical protein EON79_11170 [bacterium]|nr:MAG: hypothetical protein EON79_11170 [bacterium]